MFVSSLPTAILNAAVALVPVTLPPQHKFGKAGFRGGVEKEEKIVEKARALVVWG